MSRKITVGIDVGTFQIKVVVAEQSKHDQRAHILGTGFAMSRGIRHGYVISRDDLVRTLQSAIAQAVQGSVRTCAFGTA